MMIKKSKNALLFSGILAVIVYFIHVVIGGILWQGYSHLQQPISDLTATGAPNKDLMFFFTTLYGILALLFAVTFTILESRKHHKFVFWGGVCFVVLHFISNTYSLFPQDLPGTMATFSGIMHIAITALIVPFTILTPFLIGFGMKKESYWKKFGIYSIITGILIIIFGTASGVFYSEKLPYFGLVERLNIGTLQLWTLLLSLKLLMAK